jgi:hypothetical protein
MVIPDDITLDLNMLGKDEFAPLHVASSVGNEAIAAWLLFEKKVDPNI